MSRVNFCILFFLFIISCDDIKDGFIKTKSFEIEFKELSNSGAVVKQNHYINLFISASDLNDSIVFSSYNHGLNGVSTFLYDSLLYNSIYSEIFNNIEIGDSVVFSTDFNLFLKSFFKYDNYTKSSIYNQVKINLKLISCLEKNSQNDYNKKLTIEAIEKEKNKVNNEKKNWDLNYDDVDIVNSIYTRLITKNTYNYVNNDSAKGYYVIDYNLMDLDGRLIFSTDPNQPHYFQKNKQGQLLKGFNFLLKKYSSGDSVHAILPSNLAFNEKGAFVAKIPPFTPLLIKLRIR
ncbi:MAG: hypothetical protein CL846_06360 [Crocinitomicaceae bacterium]|nr:hypothetical protein [Crocinitomicaceae bacterium]|tara:strand:- start:1562 stop:2431 length:870 start_codon:yes stop_codon:yes gene_type:complete